MTARAWILAILLVGALAHSAGAYPHFQLSSGSGKCSQCHVDPAGGGLLSPWGQSEYGDALAMGGDGSFLHGLVTLPDAIQIGGDLRVAALANDVGSKDGIELAAFPMQLDLAMRVATGPISFVVVGGARGRVRSGASASAGSAASEVPETSLASYVISREHYVMWRPEEMGPYVRAGRFAAPFGLRIADHTTYVRRFTGYNLMEETYGVSGGFVNETLEVHATGFVFDPLQGAAREELGGALMFEVQPSSMGVVGVSARAGIADTTRLSAGVHAKLWLDGAKLLLQGEAVGVRELFEGPGDRWQAVGYVGPTVVVTRGLYTGVAYQVFAEDVEVRAVTRHSGDAWLSWFPTAHVELMWTARAQFLGPEERAYQSMLLGHYSL